MKVSLVISESFLISTANNPAIQTIIRDTHKLFSCQCCCRRWKSCDLRLLTCSLMLSPLLTNMLALALKMVFWICSNRGNKTFYSIDFFYTVKKNKVFDLMWTNNTYCKVLAFIKKFNITARVCVFITARLMRCWWMCVLKHNCFKEFCSCCVRCAVTSALHTIVLVFLLGF